MTASTLAGRGGLPGALAAEWTKLWSVRSTWWCLLAALVLTAAGSLQFAIITANSNTDADPANDTGVVAAATMAGQAMSLAQFAVIALAMLLITVEYSAGTMRSTLVWVPVRGRMLAAKAVVTAAVCFAAGLVLALAGTGVAVPLLGEWGRLGPGEVAADILAIAVYLALIGLVTLGVGTALRSAVGTLTTVFMVVTVLPAILGASGVPVLVDIADALPGAAGSHLVQGHVDPYPPVVAAALLMAWSAAALALGYTVLRRRDA